MLQRLFGGAITCELSPEWSDLSSLRKVPDHQECWLDQEGKLLVVEILEMQQQVADSDAAPFFFHDLAEANQVRNNSDMMFSTQTISFDLSELPDDSAVCFGRGYQLVTLGREFDLRGYRREQERQWIQIDLCVIRLRHCRADILITLSTPENPSPINDTMSSQLFLDILSSFRILDFSLFGYQ